MAWTWAAELVDGDIISTDDEPDGEYVFATFAEARGALAKHFDDAAADMRDCAHRVRRLRLKDAQDHGGYFRASV